MRKSLLVNLVPLIILLILPSCISGPVNTFKEIVGITPGQKKAKAERIAIKQNATHSEAARQLAHANYVGTDLYIERYFTSQGLMLTPELTWLGPSSKTLTNFLGYPLKPLPIEAWLNSIETAQEATDAVTKTLQEVRVNYADAMLGLDIAEADLANAKSPAGMWATTKSWAFSLTWIAVIGSILAIVLSGGALTPVVVWFWKTLIGVFPMLLKFVGVVGKGTLCGIIKSLDKFKGNYRNGMLTKRIDADSDDTMYTKKQVLVLLDGIKDDLDANLKLHLNENNTKADRNIINHFRESHAIKAAKLKKKNKA